MKPYKILQTETLIQEPYCHIQREKVQLPDGSQADWYCHLTPDAVIVVAQTPDGEYLLQKNYKHGSRKVIHEFCAGMIDPGETPLEAAKRELAEETGYSSEEWECLGETYSSPTSSEMKYHFFLAQNATKTKNQQLEAAEQIEVYTAKDLSAVKQILKQGPSSSACLGALSYL